MRPARRSIGPRTRPSRGDEQYPPALVADDDDEAGDAYPGVQHIIPKSAIRYRDTNQSIGPLSRRRYEVTQGAPPVRRASAQSARETEPAPRRRRVHPVVFVGMALLIAVIGWGVLTVFANWWTNTTQQWTYGYPRTYQTDAVVGHNDSQARPSHFIAVNLNGQVEVIEFPGGDATHAHMYTGLTIVGQNADLIPVTLSFQDVNGDGTLDMIVSVGNTHYIFLNEKGQLVKANQQS